MASLGHIAIGLAVARATRPARGTTLAFVAAIFGWSALSLLPDLDVVGRAWGIRYGDEWGHRGATHSFVFCAGLGAIAGVLARARGGSALRVGAWVAFVLISHPLLDVLTDGGRGCALFWPFDQGRYFAPFRPIPVAPIGRAYVSAVGLRVALAELVMFSPLLLYALWPRRDRS